MTDRDSMQEVLAILNDEQSHPRDRVIFATDILERAMAQPEGQLYKHYKGNIYRFIDDAVHTETSEHLVIYASIETPSVMWARPYELFHSHVGEGLRFTPLPEPPKEPPQ